MARHSLVESEDEQEVTCGICGSSEHTDMWHDEYWGEGDEL